jgi:hypothetical protein
VGRCANVLMFCLLSLHADSGPKALTVQKYRESVLSVQ